jgi:phenylpyruvate tautomerase PptA (4-oxalocrotonate tautomerase family)
MTHSADNRLILQTSWITRDYSCFNPKGADPMPLARIDIPAGKAADYRSVVGDTVYQAMIRVLNVPPNDRFQVISEHAAADLVIDPDYLGIHRSAEAIVIQVTLNEGRTLELKKAFYKAVADDLQRRAGLRREDVFISLVEVKKENWSFGNGEAQYAP